MPKTERACRHNPGLQLAGLPWSNSHDSYLPFYSNWSEVGVSLHIGTGGPRARRTGDGTQGGTIREDAPADEVTVSEFPITYHPVPDIA